MEFNTKELLLEYAIIAKRRFFKKEKIRFIKSIEGKFKKLGYKTSLLSPKNSKGNAINLLIGNVLEAETIIIANYDTPIKNFNLFNYHPFDARKRNILYAISALIPSLIITLLLVFYTSCFIDGIHFIQGEVHWNTFISIVIYSIGILLIAHYAKGIPNNRNINRNSASVISLLQCATSRKIQNNNKIAFVLTDFGCVNHLGDQMLKEYIGKSLSNKRVIILDCIAYGDVFAVAYSSQCKKMVDKLDNQIKRFKSNHEAISMPNLYPNCMIISAGTIKKAIFYCPYVNSRKDIHFSIENIEYIKSQIVNIVTK